MTQTQKLILSILLTHLLPHTSGWAVPIKLHGDSAVYDKNRDIITLNKNAIATSADGTLSSKKIVYNENTDILTATGRAKFISGEGYPPLILNANTVIYNRKNSILNLRTGAKAENNQAILTAQILTYNQNTNILQSEGNSQFVSKTRPLVLRGEQAIYNSIKQSITLNKNAVAQNTQAQLKSHRITYDEITDTLFTMGDTVFTSTTNNVTLNSENATYDNTNKIIVLQQNAIAENNEAIVQANRITYNQNTDILDTQGDTIFTTKQDSIVLNSQDAEYNNKDKIVTLTKDAHAENINAILQADTIIYNQNTNILTTNKNTTFYSKQSQIQLQGESALYNQKLQTITLRTNAVAENTDGILKSDILTYNQSTQILNAIGDVYYTSKDTTPDTTLILQGDTAQYNGNLRSLTLNNNTKAWGKQGKLTADTIIYNDPLDLVQATGAVQFTNSKGETSTMDTLRSNINFDTMSGTNIRRSLRNNVLVSARIFQTYPDGDMKAERTTYTSCLVSDDKTTPTWIMRADRITLDEESQNIAFTNSRMELGGVPIYYWPYVEQPTPDVVKKDGWLIPDVASGNTFGLFIQGHYYTSINNTSDALISPIYTSRKGQGLEVLYRKNTPDSITRHNISLITNLQNPHTIQGHWFASYVKNQDKGWQYKLNYEHITKKTYFKDNNFFRKASKDTLKTAAKATKINASSIFSIETTSYQDIRQNNAPQTTLFPNIQYEKNILGVHGKANLNIKATARSIQKQSTLKSHTISTTITYSRPFVTTQGILIKTDLVGRGDTYRYNYYTPKIRDNEDYTKGNLTRFTPMVSMIASYPLVYKSAAAHTPKNRQVLIEPVAGIFISRTQQNPYWLPNNDTVDFELDESNLFSNNRYAGVDKIDSGQRLSYGSRLKVWQDNTYIQAFLGQNITKDYTNTVSDYIGSLYADWKNINISANFELDSQNFSTRKLESDITYTLPKYKIDASYTKINPRLDSQLKPLAQTRLGVAYQINNRWKFSTEHTYEFEETAKGLIRQAVGFEYTTGCGCFEASVTYQQDYSKSRTTPDKTFFIQLKFREVGNIQERF